MRMKKNDQLMKHVTLHVDGSIPIADLARALSGIGCTLSSDANGEMRVSKRRIRPGRPALAVVEGEKPEKK
jgi:hypothetical protein